ncbi:MAG: deoxynucleoside kinase [Chitinophagales bacterium]
MIFYLHCNTDNLLKNIKKRGRPYEQNISKVYLNRIERMYFDYFKQNPENKFVIVDVNNIDWKHNIFAYEQLKKLFDREFKLGMNFIKLGEDKLDELPLND